MSRRSGLGKGLDALLPTEPSSSEKAEAVSSGIQYVSVENILTNPHQPRSKFNNTEMEELAKSIQEHGVIQPLIITTGEKENQYTLIAGERRLQASKIAGLAEVPVVIREATQEQMLLLALIENVQRADLSPLETAEAYKHLSENFSMTQDQIAEKVGKSRVAVTNTLSLLEMASSVRMALAEGAITEGHARALKGLSIQGQNAALKTVLRKELNVRQTEELARKYKGEKPVTEPKPGLSPEILEIQNQIENSLGQRVKLTYGDKGGTVTVYYHSDEELNKLLDKIAKK